MAFPLTNSSGFVAEMIAILPIRRRETLERIAPSRNACESEVSFQTSGLALEGLVSGEDIPDIERKLANQTGSGVPSLRVRAQ